MEKEGGRRERDGQMKEAEEREGVKRVRREVEREMGR